MFYQVSIIKFNLFKMFNVIKNLYHIFLQVPKRATISLAYKLKNLEEKIARYRNHLTFLIACRNHDVIPKGLRPSTLIVSTRIDCILHRAGMRERIKVVHSIKTSLLSWLESTTLKLKQQSELSYFEKELILQWAEYHGSITFQNTKKKQINKFHQLIHEKCQKQQPLAVQDHILDRDRLVINLTKTKLSEEQRVLELGLNIASTPKEIPKMDIVARTEEVARRIKDENVAQTLRERIKIHLEEAKPPTQNLTPSERRAITSLKKNRDLVILPADKGRATVVITKICIKKK